MFPLSKKRAKISFALWIVVGAIISLVSPLVYPGFAIVFIFVMCCALLCCKEPPPPVAGAAAAPPAPPAPSVHNPVVGDDGAAVEAPPPLTGAPDEDKGAPPPKKAARLYYLDNVKTVLTMIVVAHHTTCAYVGSGWYYELGNFTYSFQYFGLSFLMLNQVRFESGSKYCAAASRALLASVAPRLIVPLCSRLPSRPSSRCR